MFGSWTSVLWKVSENPPRKQDLENGIKLLIQVKGCLSDEKDYFNTVTLI